MIGTVMISLASSGAEPLDPAKVTPGIGGFLVFFILALASWALYRSLTTHIRRVDVRARNLAEAAERRRAADQGAAAGAGSEDAPGEVR